jgi:putative ABC transport system permease protein
MLWLESIMMALQQIRAHKMRSVLTVLGIIIGVMTVILIVSILDGYRKSIEQEIARMGANTFIIQRYEEGAVQVGEREYRPEFEFFYADELKQKCDAIAHVGIKSITWLGQVRYKNKSTNPNVIIMGTNTDYPYVGGFNIEEGRFFSEIEVENNRKVVVLGQDVVEKLFPHEPALGKMVKIGIHKFKVVGIMEKLKSLGIGGSRNNLALIPYSSFEQIYGKGFDISFVAQARSTLEFDKAISQARLVMRKLRNLKPTQKDDFAIITGEGMIQSINNVINKIRWGGIGLGLISLLVGSIGVMAIMLVSVTERTREIGIRKAIGARRKMVLFQFVIEAITLTSVGGFIGIGVGIVFSALLSALVGIPMTISLWAVLASFLTTIVLGVLAGFYPAFKASSISPIEALRYE